MADVEVEGAGASGSGAPPLRRTAYITLELTNERWRLVTFSVGAPPG